MELFRMRGWTSIIADVLVDTVLLMMSCAVGLLTGVVAVLVAGIVGLLDTRVLGGAFL